MDQADQRLLWAGAAANGALLLALIGFAGNADDPVATLRTITIPSLLAIAGFSFGGTAIYFAAARLAQRPLEAIARANIALAHRQMNSFNDVLTTSAMDARVAELVWGDQADDQIRALILGGLAAAKDATDKGPVVFGEAMKSLKACADEGLVHLRSAHRWLTTSFVAAALSVVVLLGQAWITKPAVARAGRAFVPAAALNGVPSASPLVTVTSALPNLPACIDGRPECKPWERTWRDPPPVGTVIPDRVEPPSK